LALCLSGNPSLCVLMLSVFTAVLLYRENNSSLSRSLSLSFVLVSTFTPCAVCDNGHTNSWISLAFSLLVSVRLLQIRVSWPILCLPCHSLALMSSAQRASELNIATRCLKVCTSSAFWPRSLLIPVSGRRKLLLLWSS